MLKKLNVNASIKFEVVSSNTVYKSRVEQIEKDVIWIAAPMSKGITTPISVGETLNMSFFDDSCIYTFTSEVIKREANPLPMLMVKMPDPKKIKRIQRRYYVRVNSRLPIEYGVASNGQQDLSDISYNKANTIDISGGGLQFITKETIAEDKLLHLNIALKTDALLVFGRVIRIKPYPNIEEREYWAVGVEFVNISENERDKIIKHIFDWQREMRKKGIM